MHIPKKFKQQDEDFLINSIKEIKFGALIIFSENKFFSSHIPFMIKKEKTNLILEGHVSKANELWKVANSNHKAMVIFQGANTYIHPGWYPEKTKNGKDQQNPWKVTDAPDEFIQNLVQGIIGIRFYIENVESALKMNQHHSEENRLGAIKGLSQSQQMSDLHVSRIMQKLEDDLDQFPNDF